MMTADAVMEPEGPNVLAERETGMPHSPVKAGGDKAAGSPTPSVVVVPEGKGAISSLEDDSSTDESDNGDGPEEKAGPPVVDSLPKWRTFGRRVESKQGRGRRIASLARRLTCMSLSHEPRVLEKGPVDIPESLIVTLAKNPPKRVPGQRHIPAARRKAS
jgi:hypothetical protein